MNDEQLKNIPSFRSDRLAGAGSEANDLMGIFLKVLFVYIFIRLIF